MMHQIHIQPPCICILPPLLQNLLRRWLKIMPPLNHPRDLPSWLHPHHPYLPHHRLQHLHLCCRLLIHRSRNGGGQILDDPLLCVAVCAEQGAFSIMFMLTFEYITVYNTEQEGLGEHVWFGTYNIWVEFSDWAHGGGRGISRISRGICLLWWRQQ